MPKRPTKDLIEIFGYSPDDTTQACRSLWNLGACPFLNKPCTKMNHDQSIIYGTCSVTSPFGNCIICPNRFYEKGFKVIRAVAQPDQPRPATLCCSSSFPRGRSRPVSLNVIVRDSMRGAPLPEPVRCRVRGVGPPERPPHEPLDPRRVQTATNLREWSRPQLHLCRQLRLSSAVDFPRFAVHCIVRHWRLP